MESKTSLSRTFFYCFEIERCICFGHQKNKFYSKRTKIKYKIEYTSKQMKLQMINNLLIKLYL